MAAGNHKKSSWRSALMPRRMTVGFGVCVAVAVLITEIIFLIPASYVWHRANVNDAIERVRMAWYHASDPAAFLTPEHKARLGDRMIDDGLILGGVVYDTAGEPLAVFGERPVFDLNIARLSNVGRQESPTSPALDVHFAPEQTNMSHHIIVRLPMAPIEATTLRELRNFGLSVLFIAGFTSFLFIIASMFMLVRPLRQINAALRLAVQNPDDADRHQLEMTREDEIGQISRSLNMLLTSVSVVYQDELTAMEKALESFGFAIMQYDHDGRLIAANGSAVTLFGQPDFQALRTMNRNCAQPLGAQGVRPRPILDLIGDSSDPIFMTLHTDDRHFTAMGYGASARREDGTFHRRFVALMAMDEVFKDTREAMVDAKRAKAREERITIEARELRRLLEACLCLLEPVPADGGNYEPYFLPDRILNDWYQEASRDGLVSGTLEHGLLPPMSGDKTAIRNVLRQAMLLAYAHSRADRPALKVDASKRGDGKVTMAFSDVSHMRDDVGATRAKTIDPTLPLAALQSALRHAGGRFIDLDTRDGSVCVRLELNLSGQSAGGMPNVEASQAVWAQSA